MYAIVMRFLSRYRVFRRKECVAEGKQKGMRIRIRMRRGRQRRSRREREVEREERVMEWKRNV